MISIKRFLNHSEDEAVFWQAVSMLLDKIGSQAVQGDRAEYEAFGRKFEQIRESLASSATPESLLVTVGSAAQTMSDYNRRVTRFIRRQGSEIHNIISMLTDTVVKMSGENTRFSRNFQEIGNSMERFEELESLADLKIRLRECLSDFRDETLRQKAEMEGVISELQQQVERSSESAGAIRDIDPATGLPQQDAAEELMHQSLKAGTRKYIVTMVVNRVQSINARFGYQVGDRVLRTCREHVEKHLSPGDQLFRWAGPTIVLVMERADPLEAVRVHLKRILDTKIEESFDLGTRSVLIPISMAWSAFKLVSPVGIAVRQIQTFVASQSPRDFA
jgi:diguanylate cyclase (GGDEF)-like protein